MIRKGCHGLSLYVILSKVIVYQSLEEVQATKIRSSNLRSYLPKILPSSLLKIFILSNPYQGVGPKFFEEKSFSWIIKVKISFLRKISSFCGLYPKLDLHSISPYLQAYKSS
jgi:hypothetical protein